MEVLQHFRVKDLKNYLSTFKLKKSGNKSSLISRLSDFFTEHPYLFNKYVTNKTDLSLFTSIELNPHDNVITNNKIEINSIKEEKLLNVEDCMVYFSMIQLNTLTHRETFLSNNILKNIYKTFDTYHLSNYPVYNTYCKSIQEKSACYLNRDIIFAASSHNNKLIHHLSQIYNYLTMMLFFSNKKNTEKVGIIQKFIRKINKKKLIQLRGPGYFNRSVCVNEEDFLTFESFDDIKDIFFYSYKDVDNKIYGFNINSLVIHINDCKSKKKPPFNPYNNLEIHQNHLNIIKKLYKKTKVTTENKIVFKNKSQFIYAKAMDVFHKFDMLNNYTDVTWFLQLNLYNLRKLYAAAEDIWNYRAMHLTPEIKKRHIPNNDAFTLKPNVVCTMTSKFKIQNIILDEFYKFLTEGVTIEERKTGALWMLTALVQVSPGAANSYPWLMHVE